MSDPTAILADLLSNILTEELTMDEYYAKKIRNLVCSTLANDIIDDAAKCRLVSSLIEKTSQNGSLCERLEIPLVSLYALLSSYAHYTNNTTFTQFSEDLRKTLSSNVSSKLRIMAVEITINSWISELRNESEECEEEFDDSEDISIDDRQVLPSHLRDLVVVEEFISIKFYFLLDILIDAYSDVKTNKIDALFASTATKITELFSESISPPPRLIIPLLEHISKFILVILEKHLKTTNDNELLRKRCLTLLFTSITTLVSRLSPSYVDLLDEFLMSHQMHQRSKAKLLGDMPQSNVDLSAVKEYLTKIFEYCSHEQKPLNIDSYFQHYFNFVEVEANSECSSVLRSGHLLGFYILFSNFVIPTECKGNVESLLINAISEMIQQLNTSFTRYIVLNLIWTCFLKPKHLLQSKYFVKLVEVLTHLAGSSQDHVVRFLAFQYIEIIIKEILSDNDILQMTLLKIITELTPFENVTSSAWSLLKDVLVSKLTNKEHESSPFLSPFFVETFETLYTLGRPSSGLIESADGLCVQLQSCHGKVTFLYYLINKDENNLENVNTYIDDILADDATPTALKMELYALNMAVDRLQIAISSLS